MPLPILRWSKTQKCHCRFVLLRPRRNVSTYRRDFDREVIWGLNLNPIFDRWISGTQIQLFLKIYGILWWYRWNYIKNSLFRDEPFYNRISYTDTYKKIVYDFSNKQIKFHVANYLYVSTTHLIIYTIRREIYADKTEEASVETQVIKIYLDIKRKISFCF